MSGQSLTWQQHLTRAGYALSVAIAVSLYHGQPSPTWRVQLPADLLTADATELSEQAAKSDKCRGLTAVCRNRRRRTPETLKVRGDLL